MTRWQVCKGRLRTLVYSADGRTLYSAGGRDSFVTAWDVQTHTVRFQHGHNDKILCLAVSADGTVAGSADKGGAIHLWDAATGDLRNVLRTEPPGVVSLAFTPDLLGLAGAGPRAYWWNDPLLVRKSDAPAFDEDLIPWRGHAVAVTISPDGRWLAAAGGGYDPCYVVQRVQRVKGVKPGWTRRAGFVQASAFQSSMDGRWMAIVHGRVVELHEMKESGNGFDFTSERRAVLKGHGGPIRGIAFHPNGSLLLTGSTDGTARLWSIPTGDQVQAYDWGVGKLSAVAFASDGFTCAVGGENGEMVIWDVEE